MSGLVQQSIFESIKRLDEQGNEFWLARELMPTLGYKKWERFSDVVEIAKDNLEAEVELVSEHVSLFWEASGRTKRENYKLSRLASYHVALSCDSRGNEQVKAAKHYFAVKAREAETIIPAQSEALRLQSVEIEKLKIQLELAKTQERLALQQQKLMASVQMLETISPGLAPLALGRTDAVITRVEYVERVIDGGRVDEGIGITRVQKRFGFKNTNQAWAWLESIGYGKNSGKWDLKLTAVEAHKITPEILEEIALQHYKRNGDRQLLLGEGASE